MSSSTKKKAKKPSGKAASASKKAKKPVVKQKTKTKEKKEIEEVSEKGLEKKEEKELTKKVSTKPKAKSPEKKESPPRTVAKAVPKILGPAPSATIISRYMDSTQERGARGFWLGELESASISLIEARNQKLSVDIRRRTVLNDNIESLKAWLKAEPPSSEK